MIIFLPWNVVKEKLILAGRGRGIPENVAVGVRGCSTSEQHWWAEILQMLMVNQMRDEEVLVSKGWSSMQLPLP